MDTKEQDTLKEHASGDPQAVGTFKLKEVKIGWAEIQHGLNQDNDYVWHFSTHHPKRVFPPDFTIISRAIVTYLEKVIPNGVKRDFFPPPENWEKKVITVVARGLGDQWNFDEESMGKYLPKIAEYINEEIDNYYTKR